MKKNYNLKKSVIWDCRFFHQSETFRTFSQSLTLFFTFSLHHLESQIDTYVKDHQAYKNIWTPEIGQSLEAQIEPNNPADKYAVCIRKSGKVVGYLKRGAIVKFAKTIFFFLRGDPYSMAKTITSGRRFNLGDVEGFAGSLQTKACWSSKVYRLIDRWTYQNWNKFKLRNYDAKYIFFFTFCSAQCFNPIQDELLRGCSRMRRGKGPPP